MYTVAYILYSVYTVAYILYSGYTVAYVLYSVYTVAYILYCGYTVAYILYSVYTVAYILYCGYTMMNCICRDWSKDIPGYSDMVCLTCTVISTPLTLYVLLAILRLLQSE